MSQHLSVERLSAFISGQTSGGEEQHILRHLETCPQCLNLIDGLWSETMSALQKDLVPETEDARVKRMRRRALRRIHSSEVGRSIVQLALYGPIHFIKGLLGPLQGKSDQERTPGGSR